MIKVQMEPRLGAKNGAYVHSADQLLNNSLSFSCYTYFVHNWRVWVNHFVRVPGQLERFY